MSASYGWRPVSPPPPPGGEFSITLADLMARWFANDYGDNAVDRGALHGVTLDRDAMGWLEGVRSASGGNPELRKEAEQLLDAIRQHGAIVLDVVR